MKHTLLVARVSPDSFPRRFVFVWLRLVLGGTLVSRPSTCGPATSSRRAATACAGRFAYGGGPLDRQRRVHFVPLAGTGRLRLGPAQARAYGYVQGPDTVRYVAFCQSLSPGGGEDLFLQQVVTGPVQLYVALRGHGGAGRGHHPPRMAGAPRPPAAGQYLLVELR